MDSIIFILAVLGVLSIVAMLCLVAEWLCLRFLGRYPFDFMNEEGRDD